MSRIKHVGLWLDRTTHSGPQAPRERAFAEQWKVENRDRSILQLLLMTPPTNPLSSDDGSRPIFVVEQRDATIAATVVQWLGTNIGWCFLEEALASAGYRLERIPTGDTSGDSASRNLHGKPDPAAQDTREIAECVQLAHSGTAPILYGVQGVAGSNPAVPTHTTEAPYLSASAWFGRLSRRALALCRSLALGILRGDSAHRTAHSVPELGLDRQYENGSWMHCGRVAL